jgi:hypothetical protein
MGTLYHFYCGFKHRHILGLFRAGLDHPRASDDNSGRPAELGMTDDKFDGTAAAKSVMPDDRRFGRASTVHTTSCSVS